MSGEDGIQATGSLRPLLAPILHSLILCFLVLIPARLANSICLVFRIKLPLTLSQALVFAILLQWLIFGFMWMGITTRGHKLRDLVGKSWQNLRNIKTDAKSAVLLAGLLITVALLAGLLGPFKSSQGDTGPKTINESLLALFAAVTAGFTEEFIFRGYFQRQTTIIFRSEEWGLLSQAILFALAHGSEQTLVGILDKFIAGCLFGWFAMRRKSLLPGLIAHCGVNSLATLLLFWLPKISI